MTDEETRALLKEARENRDKGMDFERDNLEDANEDLKFVAGEQWHPADEETRRTEGRPILTINKTGQFIRQVTGGIRLNRPSIKVQPVDDAADIEMAEVFTGLIRNIEYQSKAQRAYIKAAESAAICGIGHFRIVTEFSDDDSFNQDIRIRRITNPFAVLWDPTAEEEDRSDAGWCFVLSEIDIDAFKEKYPEASTEGWDDIEGHTDYNTALWHTKDTVTVAEYWRKEQVKKKLALLRTGQVIDATEMKESEIALLDATRIRTVDTHKVVQYHITDREILEGPNDWIGSDIPIIPVVGEEIHIGTRVVRHGVIRHAKDSQRMYNYWHTLATETIALAPKSPYIGTDKQFENHPEWDDANAKNYSKLTYTVDTDAAGAPQRNAPPDFPVSAVNMSQIASEDMKATTGIYDANLSASGNETSGRAISLRQGKGDVGTYLYVDNVASAIEQAGRILVEIIPKVYDSERIVRVLGEDGNEKLVEINKTIGRDEDFNPILINDITVGKYDVVVKTGPTFETRRMEASESIQGFLQIYPAAAPIIGDLLAKSQDWPEADEIAARLQRSIPPGVLGGEPPPPDPSVVAKAEKDQADTAKKLAEAEGIELDNLTKQLILEATQSGAMRDLIDRVVAQKIQEFFQQQSAA